MKNITIYTSNSSYDCNNAKDFFDSHNIPYVEKNITENKESRKELLQKKIMKVPVIEIENKTLIGFNPMAVERILRDQH